MIKANEKVKFAVIGAGHIGKRHAEMISREEEGELVALVDVRSIDECDAEKFNVPFLIQLKIYWLPIWILML